MHGVIAAGFDHGDSRANDPHLHTHMVVANRVQTEPGGEWCTLDSRTLFRATVGTSTFTGDLAARLGLVNDFGRSAERYPRTAVTESRPSNQTWAGPSLEYARHVLSRASGD